MILRFVNNSSSGEDYLVELNSLLDLSQLDKYEIEDRIEEIYEETDDCLEFEDVVEQVLDEIIGEDNWVYAESETIIM